MNQITDQDLLLIERYVLNELTDAEHKTFSYRLEKEPQLQKELALQQAIKTGLEAHGERRIKKMLQAEETQLQNPAPDNSRRLNPWWWAAAAAVALAIGFWFFQHPKLPNLTQLYAQHFEVYPNVVVPLERGVPAENEAEVTFRAYEQGNYSQALSGLEALAQDSSSTAYTFYRALSLMALQKTNDAIPELQSLSQTEDRFARPARWYLALSYLQNQQIDQALPILKNLSSSEGFKQQDANQILQELGE